MNQQLQNQEKTGTDQKNMVMSYIGAGAMALVMIGSCIGIVNYIRHANTEQKQAELPAVTTETMSSETEIKETGFAAASVQIIDTDVITEVISVSETIPETEPVPTATPETYVIEVTLNSEEIAHMTLAPETTVTAIVTDLTETAVSSVSATETHVTITTTAELPTNPPATESPSVPVTEESSVMPETAPPIEQPTTEASTEPEEITFHDVLNCIFHEKRFQDDIFESINSDIDENEFAIYDVDNDGMEELVIRWSNAASASVAGIVYAFDSEGKIYRELESTPYLRFYGNGIIEADSAHSSGLSGAFWPYTLYQYDNAEGIYKEISRVEAWDKSAFDENTQEIYPEEADTSKTGFVYYLYPSDYDYSFGMPQPMDAADYHAWHDSYLKGAPEIRIPFRKMTEANISQVK